MLFLCFYVDLVHSPPLLLICSCYTNRVFLAVICYIYVYIWIMCFAALRAY